MTVRNLLIVNAILAALVTLGQILAPASTLDLYGLDANDATLTLVRLAGTTGVGYAIASWLMKDAGPSRARRAFLIGGGAGYLVFSLVAIILLIAGDLDTIGWIAAIISLLLGVAFLNFGLRQADGA